MRIACPACDTGYDVPDNRLRPGRAVRCARCDHAWEPALADAWLQPRVQTEPVVDARWEDEAAEVHVALPAITGADKRLRAAWIASGLALMLLFGSGLLWRNAVMAGWPASQLLYALCGMHPPAPATASLPAKTANATPAAHR